jgi:alpha-tubulin suppressor-like RCC1 family protein
MKKVAFLLLTFILSLGHISQAQIASSENGYTLLIKKDGSLWAWGDNSNGQLGDGTTIKRNIPVNILPNTQWISVATSYNTSFGIKKDGTLWAWGMNNSYLFGNNNSSETQRLVPGQVGSDSNWKYITTNGNIVVGLKTDGTLWNWGINNSGQLGDGTTVNKLIPTKVGTDTNWSSVTLANNTTLAIKQNGTLWAWGNNFGLFGNNSTNSSNIPIQVNSETNWKTIEAGSSHVLALKQDGSLWTWGSINSISEGIGSYSSTGQTTPLRIGTDNNWTKISAGFLTSIAIKSNGSIWSWGINNLGVSGRNSGESTTNPTQIGIGLDWENIYVGYNSSIGIKKDNSIWVWGSNQDGLLGLGIDSFKKTPIRVSSNVGWKEICPNFLGTTFGIKLDGTLWAWGNNSSGIFGNNNKTSTNTPIQIGNATNWKSIVATWGSFAAIKTDGTLWTWGDNNSGYLGTGNTTSRYTIAQAGTGTDWDKIFAIASNIYGIKSNGSLWAWGANFGNSITNTTSNSILSPVQIGTDLNWKSIGANFIFTIGLKTDGTLWSWGENYGGQLGLNSNTNYGTPQRIGNLSNWTDISTNYEGTIALNSNGNLWSWGINSQGSLGFDPLTTRQLLLPTQITSLNNVKAVTSSYNHSGAIKTDGSLYTWGKNDYGNLGNGSITNNHIGIRVGTDTNWDKIFIGASLSTYAIKTDGSLWAWGDNLYGQLGVGEFGYTSTPTQLFAAENTPKSKIFTGGNSNFEIKVDGTLWAWGNNSSGQLGIGHKNNQSYPIQVGSSNDWKYVVTANSTYTLALKNDGSLWGWGKNGTNGYLGIGNPSIEEYLTPTRIGSSSDWEIISAGTDHNLAIKSNGSLWAWGNNLLGVLGDGTSTVRTAPVQLGSDLDWEFISAGKFSSYAIKSNGKLYSWGANSYGQLGDGTSISKNVPTVVGTSSDWLNVDAGTGNVLAIKANGSLWGWGLNTSGQLGNSTLTNVNQPQQIGTSLDWISTISSKTLPFTIAKKSNGTLWSTGINVVGALGLGNLEDKNTFTQIGNSSNWNDFAVGSGHVIANDNNNLLYAWGGNQVIGKVMNNPIKQIGTLSNWNNIISGNSNSATIKSDGTLWMWGQNTNGQLGDGTRINKDVPIQIGTSSNWKSIALGIYHSVGLKTDGSIWSWGSNTFGQLGDGTTTNQLTPIQVGSSLDWKSIFCGVLQTYAIKNDGSLWAWGNNSLGMLGDGTSTMRTSPVRIGSANDWKEISSGFDHTIALKSNGTLWAWGVNSFGQLGDGTTANKSVPTQIGSSTNWKTIHTGNNHSAGLQNDGTIWFWGNNFNGQLGNSTTTNSNIPIKIGTENDWFKLALGDSHSIALKNDNTMWSWGSNANGQLGDGTVISRTLPQKIGADNDWNQITAGSHTFAIKNDGTLWGSGLNSSGQLGDGKAFFTSPSLVKPIVEITQSGKSTYCSGGSMTLTASEGLSYTWSTGATTRSITVNTSGTYSVTVSYPMGDIVSSESVVIPPRPNTTISTTGSMTVNRLEDLKTYKLTVPSATATTYQWYNNSVAIPGATKNSFVPLKYGSYSVMLSNTFGCVSSSISKTVTYTLSETLTPSAVFAGSTSSFLIKPNGTLWAWGSNNNGQLGIGNKLNQTIAVQVGTASDWKMVATALNNFTIAIKKDGSLWGWGRNGSLGYLGIGDATIAESLVPIRIGVASDWESISVGFNHIIALKTNGTIWSWGSNFDGQLGNGNTTTLLSPTQIGTDTDWASISTGGFSSYAIKNNGSLYAWGQNSFKQLGDGTTISKNTPTLIGNSTDWGMIKGSNYSVLALKTNGSLWAWGLNSDGQLGNGTIENVSEPVQIGADLSWTNVSLSNNHGFALKANGTLWSTGNNFSGQLGQGNTNNATSFTQIGTSNSWRSLALGTSNSLALGTSYSLALDNLNNLYSWGDNLNGQLGKGNTYIAVPRQVGNDFSWEKLFAGLVHSAAIKKDGSLWMWGRNRYGQLGDGLSTTNVDIPIQVGTGKDWKYVSLGGYHTLAIKANGSLWGWGRNIESQLGDGTIIQRTTPIQIGTATDWKTVSTALTHSVGVKTNGTIWFWGNIVSGTFSITSSTPIQIGSSSDWTAISAGSGHILALKSNGTLWAWGLNNFSQLGLGNTTNMGAPTQVGNATDWAHIQAGYNSSLAVKKNGTVWLWGNNIQGGLGDGTNTNKNVPTQLVITNTIKWPASTLSDHLMTLKSDGSLWMWGNNADGQLGDGSVINKNIPQRLGTDTDWTDIAAGNYHSLAIKSDGSLWAWGGKYYAQLGDGKSIFYSPTLAKPIVDITASERKTFCPGSNGGVLTASEGGLSYTWSTGATTRSITVTTGGSYSVTVTYPIGDVSTSDPYVVPAIPSTTISTTGSMTVNRLEDLKTYKLTVPSTTGVSYQWLNNGVAIPGAILNNYVPKKNGNYSVNITNTFGCVSSSISQTVTYALSDTLTPAKVFAGSASSFMIKPNGTLWAWGQNTSGQLGIGNKINQSIAVQVGTANDWKMVAAASNFTIAIKKDGSLWGWGINGSTGYLGIGDATIAESLVPIRIGVASDWESISVGYNHSLALKTNGTMWAWGYNFNGQLGIGNTTNLISPTQIGTDTDWASISTGGFSSYAIKTNGLLFAWGQNDVSQLGDGTTVNKNIPTQIGDSTDWGIVDGGNEFVSALKTDGTMWGWGSNYYYRFGSTLPSRISSPIQIGTDSNWANIFIQASGNQSFAVKTNGTLWASGDNYYGQLGNGNNSSYSGFTQIANTSNWRSAGVGSYHLLALDKQNNVFSWGVNNYGQLGKGIFSYSKSVKQVGIELTWEKIFATNYRSFAIKKDGTLWAWGLNIKGNQLGNGSERNLDNPIQIGTGTNWLTLAVGSGHTLALKTDGTLWGWGGNDDGAIGDGSTSSKNIPTQIGTATDWAFIFSGGNTSYGIKKNGTLWAWGNNNYGQIGNGNNTRSSIPIQIGTSSDWVSISAGFSHVLGLKSNGTLWAWGDNLKGQLGNGNNTNSNTPTQIGSSSDWKAIETGVAQSYALKNDGTLWAWGWNPRGELGDGSNSDKNIPILINISNINKLSVSGLSYHKMLLKADGSMWGWGSNFYGQLGNENTIDQSIPIKIGSETDWKDIATGSYHTLALKKDGSLWSWGYNVFGELGDGKALFYTPTLAKPIVEIVNTGKKTFCPGGSVVLTASEGGLSYTWSTGAKTRSITANTTGNYFVTVTYPIGDVSISESTAVTVNPLPDATISTTGSSFVFNLTDTKTYTLKVPVVTGAKYQWSRDGAVLSGATTAEYIPQTDGSYSVNVVSPFGCIANSSDFVVKYELADTDGDGIKDNADKCNNTTAGAIIDANGCEIFNLPAKNYTIGMGSATCVGSNNGSIQIAFANKNYNYLIKAVGATSGYSKQFTYNTTETAALNITGLAKDTYSVCIQVIGKEGYEQCFDVLITEPAALKTNSTFNPNSNTLVLNLSGSESYSISVNGVTEKVNGATYSKVLSTGLNKISVSTDLGCQGTFDQEIFISEQAQAYPNPTSGKFSIYVPGSDPSVRISIHTLEKTILDESRDLDHSRIITYDLSKMDAGTYVIQVSGSHVNKTLKISKQ